MAIILEMNVGVVLAVSFMIMIRNSSGSIVTSDANEAEVYSLLIGCRNLKLLSAINAIE